MKPNLQKQLNRTGLMVSPELARSMLQNSSASPSSEGDANDIALVRIEYAKQVEPAGTMPPPAVNGGKAAAKGMPLLLDKLGERLAFERSGVRLYDALISKYDAYGSWKGGPQRGDLEEIRAEENEHFLMLREMLMELGGDATAVTPSANLHGVAAKGLPAVLTDPRTNLQECLEAILIAELVDNDCWENLADLAESVGRTELASQFDQALAEERDHLRRVRLWLAASLSQIATGRPEAPSFAERARQRDAMLLGAAAEQPASRSRATTGKAGKAAAAPARTRTPARSSKSASGSRTRSASSGKSASSGRAGNNRARSSRASSSR